MSRAGFADEAPTKDRRSERDLLKAVRSIPVLYKAWASVRDSGLQSPSIQTRNEIKTFAPSASAANQNLQRLYRRLLRQQEEYRFSKAIGVPLRRPGKSARPIVVASVEDRIVQRAILEVLQDQPAIQDYVSLPTSFGGVAGVKGKPGVMGRAGIEGRPGRGVPDAIKYLIAEIKRADMKYYIRSDIRDFFRGIPKDEVISRVDLLLKDSERFLRLLRRALDVELKNYEALGDLIQLFPTPETGVAQGCCLSSLMGNILLHDFDETLNGRGVACLRYVDDFIILAKTERSARKAFESAIGKLSALGLSAYEPTKSPKAKAGYIERGFEFLGCRVIPGLISPSDDAQKRVLDNVNRRLTQSEVALNRDFGDLESVNTVVETLSHVNKILRGWGDQYYFCNDRNAFLHLEKLVTARINQYLEFYRRVCRPLDDRAMLRSLGIRPLSESKEKQIEW